MNLESTFEQSRLGKMCIMFAIDYCMLTCQASSCFPQKPGIWDRDPELPRGPGSESASAGLWHVCLEVLHVSTTKHWKFVLLLRVGAST